MSAARRGLVVDGARRARRARGAACSTIRTPRPGACRRGRLPPLRVGARAPGRRAAAVRGRPERRARRARHRAALDGRGARSMTELLAAVSAPSLGTTEVRHVELLRLQPNVVMAVVITATGGVAKRLFVFEGRRLRARRVGARLPRRDDHRPPARCAQLRAGSRQSLGNAERASSNARARLHRAHGRGPALPRRHRRCSPSCATRRRHDPRRRRRARGAHRPARRAARRARRRRGWSASATSSSRRRCGRSRS